ncbi:hypothetical protein A2482_00405 [Candidatus Falkowbacteria bacterium RIFOXYC2_FULL_48_21]|uniref:Uncharacterized protein n=1 Tax=Candidatus Falkowbacteria bacterium RIFOXYC2_FULL_48_21 TaxID=1798005 RepID=A0A1F5TFT9_9BACT|nr:MAG: hypothetical protein A2482_00405 [Candidatus Falkowbacteria bacterium RIFOXYC2_FULL_48_21]
MSKLPGEGMPGAAAETKPAGEQVKKKTVEIGDKFIVDGKTYEFAGLNDKREPVGKIEGEDLHKVVTKEQIERGLFLYQAEELLRDIQVELPKVAQDHWESECVNNSDNNPEKVEAPKW